MDYKVLIEHLRTFFEMGEIFSSLVVDFYSQSQCNKETEDQFTDKLQILTCVRPESKPEVNKALKTQFA